MTVNFMASYSPWSQMLVATAVTAGRQWPLLARDPSCRALLIGLGAMFAINPISLALWGLLWAVAFVGTGFRLAAAAVATMALPVALGIVGGWAFAGMSVPVCMLILDRQRADMRRMFLGGEAKHLWRPGA